MPPPITLRETCQSLLVSNNLNTKLIENKNNSRDFIVEKRGMGEGNNKEQERKWNGELDSELMNKKKKPVLHKFPSRRKKQENKKFE